MTTNTDPAKSVRLARDIVTHNGKQFYVSTINRESSAELSYRSIYAETLVWEWDGTQRGKIVGQDEAGEDSLVGHKRMCTIFEAHGKQLQDDDD